MWHTSDCMQVRITVGDESGSVDLRPVTNKKTSRSIVDKINIKEFAYDGENCLFIIGRPAIESTMEFPVVLDDLNVSRR